jgi:hypothetical protein
MPHCGFYLHVLLISDIHQFFIYLLAICITFFFFWYWGLISGPTPGATPAAVFCDGFFEIGSLELFAQAGLEP